MLDDLSALTNFDGVARLFPLPNLVLFPHAVQGLHIFEPRYRQMTSDALAADELIAMALLREGWEHEYDSDPEIESVACLGRITDHELLPDGRFNLRVRGLVRVRVVEELRTDKQYRTARVEPIPDVSPGDTQRLVGLRRRLAEAVLPRFEPAGPAHRHLNELFQSDTPLGGLCDLLAYSLPFELPLKQGLLAEPHVDVRAEVLIHALEIPKSAKPRKFPPDFSAN